MNLSSFFRPACCAGLALSAGVFFQPSGALAQTNSYAPVTTVNTSTNSTNSSATPPAVSPAPADNQAPGKQDEVKEYSNATPADNFTQEKPAFSYLEKLTIKRLSDSKLELTVELKGDLPRKDERRFWIAFALDLDKNVSTGVYQVNRPNFGYDVRFWLKRPAGKGNFEWGSDTVKMASKFESVEIKKIDADGKKITFTAQSPLFHDYPHFHFLVWTTLVAFDKKDDDDITSIKSNSLLPRTGYSEF